MRLSLSVERLLLVAAACASLALACQPAVEVDAVVTARSCTDGAHTMIFELNANTAIHNFFFLGGSSNVLGIPLVMPNGNNTGDWFVVTDLDNVAKNDKVTVKFQTHADVVNPINVWLAGVSFFKAGSNPTPTVPDCAPTQAPTFTITYIQPPPGSPVQKASASFSLQVSNSNPLPITLVDLDLVHVPAMLDPAVLDLDNADFNALPWQPAAPGGTILDAASPPVTTPLPDGVSGGAVLCRFTSIYDGNELSGIVQINLSAPLATKLSTWGGVKALFKN